MTDFKTMSIGVVIGIGIIIGAFFYGRNVEHQACIDAVKNAPVDTVWRDLPPVVIYRPIQHMDGGSNPGQILDTTSLTFRRIAEYVQKQSGNPRVVIDTACQAELELCQGEIRRLIQPADVELPDMYSGKHQIRYIPLDGTFHEDYFPDPDTLYYRFGIATKNVVLEGKNNWLVGVSFEYFGPTGLGIGGQIGFKSVYVGITKYMDESSLLIRVGTFWEF